MKPWVFLVFRKLKIKHAGVARDDEGRILSML